MSIKGYNVLTPEQIALINTIKSFGESIGDLVAELEGDESNDQRWISKGKMDLQVGIMSLVRSVAKPSTF